MCGSRNHRPGEPGDAVTEAMNSVIDKVGGAGADPFGKISRARVQLILAGLDVVLGR